MNFEFDYWPLFLIFAIAWLIPMIMTFLGLTRTPTVIIEIIAGILIGPFVLDLMPSTDYIDFLALTGFVFLMFLSGLEIDIEAIVCTLPKKNFSAGKFITNPLLSGIIIYLLTLALAFLSAVLLSVTAEDIRDYWYFALIMSTSSVGIILPVLKDRGEVNMKRGQLIMLAAARSRHIEHHLVHFYCFFLSKRIRLPGIVDNCVAGCFCSCLLYRKTCN
jgi:Kef-type K+ transport system membrane component KefB